MTSMPTSACWRVTSATASATRAASWVVSILWPSKRARRRALTLSGRGILPTCVVKIRLVLLCILVPSTCVHWNLRSAPRCPVLLVRDDRVGRGVRLHPQRAVGKQADLLRRHLLRLTVRPAPHSMLPDGPL